MNDPHLNIFHAYRGPNPSEDAALRQLEDNLTRALMITLEHVRTSPRISERLLKNLGVANRTEIPEYQCYLQVNEPRSEWPSKNRRQLLIIHGGPSLSVTSVKSHAKSGRIDGLVSSSEFVIGIESKIGNTVGEDQINRHRELLGIERDQVTHLTWSRLARDLSAIRLDEISNGVSGFIVKQFEEYLRMNGFGGFTAEHFSYFALPQASRDSLVKDGIRRVLEEHAAPIADVLGTHWKIRVLNILAGSQDTGVVIEPGKPGQDPHMTLGISPSDLSILANIELSLAYRRFMSAWESNPESLIELVRDLGREQVTGPTSVPWRLGIKRRVPLDRPRQYHYWQSTDLALNSMVDWPDTLMSEVLSRLFAQPEYEAVPEIFFLRSYPASLVLQQYDVSGWLKNDTERLKPFFRWLEMI